MTNATEFLTPSAINVDTVNETTAKAVSYTHLTLPTICSV